MQRLYTLPEQHMFSIQSAGAVSSLRLRQSQASRQGKGKLLQVFSTQASHGAVCASASASTENRCLLTSQALLVPRASLGRQQAFVAFVQSAAVTRLLLCCQNWILHLRAVDLHKSTQSIASYASSALACLELRDLLLFLLCCKRPMQLYNTCGALRPLSAAVSSNPERCAGRLVVLCRTSTHGDVCAYSDAFLSRGTRAERDL